MKHLLFLSLLGLTAASHSCDIAGQVRHRSLDSRTRSLTYALTTQTPHWGSAVQTQGSHTQRVLGVRCEDALRAWATSFGRGCEV